LSPGQFSVMVARKRAGSRVSSSSSSSPSSSWEATCGSVLAAHRGVLDEWFREVNPLATAERLSSLKEAWARRVIVLSSGSGSSEEEAEQDAPLSLADAYETMFSEDERREFTMEYFLDDVAAFRSEGSMANPEKLSLTEAVNFLEKNQ